MVLLELWRTTAKHWNPLPAGLQPGGGEEFHGEPQLLARRALPTSAKPDDRLVLGFWMSRSGRLKTPKPVENPTIRKAIV